VLGRTRGEAGWSASAAAGPSALLGGYTRYFESDWLSLALSFEVLETEGRVHSSC
jgi:hypothetical protein